jgi:hypothetical protein
LLPHSVGTAVHFGSQKLLFIVEFTNLIFSPLLIVTLSVFVHIILCRIRFILMIHIAVFVDPSAYVLGVLAFGSLFTKRRDYMIRS